MKKVGMGTSQDEISQLELENKRLAAQVKKLEQANRELKKELAAKPRKTKAAEE